MKRLLFCLLLSVWCGGQHLHAQNADNAAYDSIMAIMRDQSLPLLERYYMTGEIDHFSPEQRINILKSLVPEAREYEDKAVPTRLYAVLAHANCFITQMDEAKHYLDSALYYKDYTDNKIILGLVHYTAGVYYTFNSQFTESHTHYYKAAEYFNSKDPKPAILTEVYYNLSVLYALRWNEEGLRELREWMEEAPVEFVHHLILKETVSAQYFYVTYEKHGGVLNLDSAAYYNNKATALYNPEEHPYDVGYQVSENYFMLANIHLHLGEITEAEKCLEKGKQLMNKEDEHKYILIHLIAGKIYSLKQDYPSARRALEDGLKLVEKLNKDGVYFSHYLTEYYSRLSVVYEKQGMIEEALNAERQSLQENIKFIDATDLEYVKDLRAKYDLDNKQRLVNQLSEINAMYKRNRTLMIGIGALLLIVFVLIFLRMRASQKAARDQLKMAEMKKEESEQRYQLLLSENKLKQVSSYLEGLETERLRLSKELHDNVSNNLLAVGMALQADSANREDISRQLQAIHQQVRNISHELIPPEFTYASFTEIVEDFVTTQNRNQQVDITLELDSREEIDMIPEDISLELYRIIQEAIGNVLKHARATSASIRLTRRREQIELVITDNGIGFHPQVKPKGIGLIIIRERVKRLNGQLSIQPSPAGGTELKVQFRL